MSGESTTTTTTVFVVRHGETQWNKEKRLQGQHDPPLNQLGSEQAREVAEYVSQGELGKIEAIYTSDLIRASDTALAISQRCGIECHKRQEFREKGLGVIEGLTLQECAVKQPEAYAKWRKGKPVPEAEDSGAVEKRLRKGLLEIEGKHRGGRVLVVTHGGILNTIHKMITGEKYPDKIPNTSISTIRSKGQSSGNQQQQWEIDTYASCSHLVGKVDFDNGAFGGVGDTA